tara:strand:+ start:255 stop:617 length:363 start_codon:yes stop_codon:yes gene_type:complete
MLFNSKKPVREFRVGIEKDITIKDCGSINLEPNEQVSFITDKNAEYDVVRKSWGFYATPSTNKRLKNFGLRAALVKNSQNNYFIMLVEKGFEDDFFAYLKKELNEVIVWLDEDEIPVLKV